MKSIVLLGAACAAAAALAKLPVAWDREELFRMPTVYSAADYVPGGESNGVKAVFLEGLPFRGKATRDFAYWGVPAVKAGEKAPAMVLVHGGGGSAFHRWVKFWNSRGYAAISMDLNGCVSGNTIGDEMRRHISHPWQGPGPGCGGFAFLKEKPVDQWMYHAVGAVVRAHTFLRAQPGVDSARIGLTGVSWGGVVNCVVAAVDDRLKFAIPVYGCGFLYEDYASWYQRGTNKKPSLQRREDWCPFWDPMQYLADAKIPVHWIDGSNDQNFSYPSLMRSFALVPTPKSLSLRVRMGHAHGAVSEKAIDVLTIADAYLKNGPKPPVVGTPTVVEGKMTAAFTADAALPVVAATLDYTCDDKAWWWSNTWHSVKAELKPGQVSASLPQGARYYHLTVETSNKSKFSTVVLESR